MKNLLRKLHLGGNNDDQVDGGRIIEGRSSEGSGGSNAGVRAFFAGAPFSSSPPGASSAAGADQKPSGFSTWLNAVGSAVGRHSQSPSTASASPNSNQATGGLPARPRIESFGGSGGNASELEQTRSLRSRDSSSNGLEGQVDFQSLEEEYQVQIAMALSVSNNYLVPKDETEVEKAQIEAVKRISLGLSPSKENSEAEVMTSRYWACNIVDYDEAIPNGFYDVYSIGPQSSLSERMPSLAELQRMTISDGPRFEAILVNREADPDLVDLEKKALALAAGCGTRDTGPFKSLAQKLALLVAEHMGGPVSDDIDVAAIWRTTNSALKSAFRNNVLNLGCLNVGLTRHRALLFKVLADCVGLRCQLVKGRHYPGVEKYGAVNILLGDDNREYIIDLMGAPGALIPPDQPGSNSLQVTGEDIPSTDVSPKTAKSEQLVALVSSQMSPSSSRRTHEAGARESDVMEESDLVEAAGNNMKLRNRHHSEPSELEGLDLKPPRLNQHPSHWRSPSWTEGIGVPGGRQMKDVSQFMMDAAKDNPQLAQKLHDVLLESGVVAPSDLFTEISPKQLQAQVLVDKKVVEDKKVIEEKKAAEEKKLAYPPKRTGRPPPGLSKPSQQRVDEGTKDRLQRLNSVEGLGERRPLETVLSNTSSPPSSQALTNTPVQPVVHEPFIQPELMKHVPVAAAAAATAAVVASTMVAAAAKGDLGIDLGLDVPMAAAATATAAVVVATSAAASRKDSNDASSNNSSGDKTGSGGRRRHGDDRRFDEAENNLSGHSHDRGASNYGDGLDGEVSAEEERNSDHLSGPVQRRFESLLGDVAEWEIPWEDIVIGERIGLGSYGEVYRGDWHGTEVAVKKFLDQDLSGDALEEFRSEVRIMRRLRHPNVVLFMGAITRPPHLSIVTEFLPRGSLYRLIHRPNNQLDERRRLRMALDVAKGMNYLHSSSPVIVHRDLKSPNLLVDKNWVVKVCDFGLSRMKHNTFLSSKSTAGTPEWMAPEVLRNEPSNEKSDVYSFGVILWELATLQQPWNGMNPMQVVGAVGFQHRRLDLPHDIDQTISKIIYECWQNDPNLRPSFSQLMAALRPLQRPMVAQSEINRQSTQQPPQRPILVQSDNKLLQGAPQQQQQPQPHFPVQVQPRSQQQPRPSQQQSPFDLPVVS